MYVDLVFIWLSTLTFTASLTSAVSSSSSSSSSRPSSSVALLPPSPPSAMTSPSSSSSSSSSLLPLLSESPRHHHHHHHQQQQLQQQQASNASSLNQSSSSSSLVTCEEGTDEYKDFYDMAQYITGLIVYPILCIIGITGNILALVVLSHRDMRTSTNVYLSSLAVSDTIKLLNDLMYFVIVAISQNDPDLGSRAMSLVYPLAHYVFNMAVCVTAWLTVSVAVERFISVCHASRAKELCTIKRARLICTVVFVSMSVLAIPSGLRYRMTSIYDPVLNVTCVRTVPTELGNNAAFMVSYSWIQNSLRGLIPVFILVFLNVRIVNELRKERVKGKKFSARNRITIMLVSIVFMFLVCITPDAIMSTFLGKGYVEEGFLVKGIREITDSLLAVNSAFSFVLYCAMSAIFRATFIKIFCPAWISGSDKDAILLNRRTQASPANTASAAAAAAAAANPENVVRTNGCSKTHEAGEGEEEFL